MCLKKKENQTERVTRRSKMSGGLLPSDTSPPCPCPSPHGCLLSTVVYVLSDFLPHRLECSYIA